MTLPRPIVAYHKQAPDYPDPFGTWCKLHHAFLTHLAEARLSGAAYKVVLQVLCAAFHFGQYHPVALSLDQFQRSQHLGRKAVIEGLRQALAKGILYEEREWQKGEHAPKCYGLIFYRALAGDRSTEDASVRHQGMTLLKGDVSSLSERAFEPGNPRSSQARKSSSSIIEPHREMEEEFKETTGAEIEPVVREQPAIRETTGTEIEPEAVRQPNQKQCGNRTSASALTEPEAVQQRRWEAASHITLEKEERRDNQRTPATLVPPPEAAPKDRADLGEKQTAPFQQPLLPAVTAAPPNPSSSGQQTSEFAMLREEYERRQAELKAWHPHGVEQIQAKIAARLEVRRLERQIEELETALELQDQRTQEGESTCVVGAPDEACLSTAGDMSALEPAPALPLQVAEEQLVQWRADVAAQQREVTRVTTQYHAVTEQLQHCHIGRGTWGTLVREQRFLAGEVEEQKAELARYERFLALIEAGATREEACEQLLAQPSQEVALEAPDATEQAPTEPPSEDEASTSPPEPAPRLEGQPLRKALFATLVRLFTTGDSRHVELERGKFNRAIKNLVLADLQPEEIPILKATYERLWPRITCTALGLANHLPLLIEEARKRGYEVGVPLESPQEVLS